MKTLSDKFKKVLVEEFRDHTERCLYNDVPLHELVETFNKSINKYEGNIRNQMLEENPIWKVLNEAVSGKLNKQEKE